MSHPRPRSQRIKHDRVPNKFAIVPPFVSHDVIECEELERSRTWGLWIGVESSINSSVMEFETNRLIRWIEWQIEPE